MNDPDALDDTADDTHQPAHEPAGMLDSTVHHHSHDNGHPEETPREWRSTTIQLLLLFWGIPGACVGVDLTLRQVFGIGVDWAYAAIAGSFLTAAMWAVVAQEHRQELRAM